ncbi:MAG TPA: diacylglycerol kinase family protein [Acidimicrobiales bacterium]
MRPGRFLRRGLLRAALAGVVARPLGAPAAVSAAVTGGAQEHAGLAAATGAAGAVWLARRRAATRVAETSPAASTHPARAGGEHGWGLALRLLAGAGIGLGTRLVWQVAPQSPAAVRPHRAVSQLAASHDGAGVGIVVNRGAGPAVGRSDDLPGAVLRAALPAATVVELDGGDSLVDVLGRLADAGCRAIGVAGGDGSINAAAGVAIERGIPLVAVPAGTLNHLARDLGVETVDDAVDALRAGQASVIDVGWVAGRPFLNTASFGSYVDLVDARQELERRIGKWPAMAVALARVLRRGGPVEVELDGEPRSLWMVFVGNCRYQPDGMAPTWRERLDDGKLDVRVVDASHPFCRTRLLLAALTGTLRRSRVFETWQTAGLRVRSADGPLRLARDGETFDGPAELEVTKDGARLAVYTPRRPRQAG